VGARRKAREQVRKKGAFGGGKVQTGRKGGDGNIRVRAKKREAREHGDVLRAKPLESETSIVVGLTLIEKYRKRKGLN